MSDLLNELRALHAQHAESVAQERKLDEGIAAKTDRLQELAERKDDVQLQLIISQGRIIQSLQQRVTALESLLMRVGVSSIETFEQLGVEFADPPASKQDQATG